jgi:hypothetical protein
MLRHKPIFQIAKPSTLLEMALGQEHIPQSQLLGLLLEILNDRGMRRKPFLRRFPDLPHEDGVGWYAFFFDKFLDLGGGGISEDSVCNGGWRKGRE